MIVRSATNLLDPPVSSATNVDSPISKEITPSQKRDLLFNINHLLELPVQEFDDNWWPLVSNVWTVFNFKKKTNGDSSQIYTCRLTKCKQSSTRKEGIPSNKRRKTKIRPSYLCFAKIKVTRFITEGKVHVERFQNSPNHTHSLEESDKIKRPQIIRNLVEQEALKNYRPPAILNAVKEYAAERMDLDACVKELRRKEVTNIKYKVRGALDAHLIGNPNRELDIQESIFFLENQKYLVERYMISHKSTHDFVFMHPNQIKNLEKYGWLTLIDSTHKTNRYDYRLFTLYIRNEFGCWDVGAHFFVSNEDSDTVAEALKTIRRFAVHWKPRYFLQDQSNVEANVFNFKKKTNGDSSQIYTCRLTKCKQSSTRKEGIPSNKRRKTKIRPSYLCFAKIKVTRFITEGKVHVERFQNSPNHTHSLEESDKIKRPQIIRNLVEQEALKNYRPPAILNAVKEYAAERMDLDACVKELRRKEVTNIKYKVRGALDAHLIGNPNRELDIQESIFFLENQKYLVERYMISHKSTHDFVFMHPNQIKNLEKYGWLTLIDSTHKTNRYDYRLFTLYIRNEFGCWDVGAHFFVSNEDSDTVAEALKTIRRFAVHWKPRYFLQDQSNVEANGIKMAFPGLKNGEQECDTIFCTVYLVRTWMSKIYEVKTRQKMIQAMHKWTRIGCEALIQQAIEECPVPTIKQYIKRYYVKNNHQWALWARQHSPLLLQVTSTNSLESYHSELKRTTSSQHGLIGACHKVVEPDQKKRTDSEYVAFEFRTKKISIVGISDEILNEIHKFPFPVQRMLADEACAVEKRIEKGKAAPKLISLSCNCLFYRRYLIPCRHIFHEHMYGFTKLLFADAWAKFQFMFEENGFDVYTHQELIMVDILEETKAKRAAENRRLAINELMERTRDMYWRVEEKGDERQTGAFLEKLQTCLEPILKAK
ncbi:hypothetical protein Glove_388g20 [Diversispora epigaea]|uniref:ZSWIM1/3 RNaseH-like domain-containing protein n=1 Tax=Diversispora epigaea TaxID=1348612 RepID=A0A397H2R3_9GLOM|nr:hypothetical protein Glove_388g20 [Diversispora epigaea]